MPNAASVGSISGTVFFDLDMTHTQNTGNGTFGGSVVTLFDANGVPLATSTTSGSGYYSFTNLAAGTYGVHAAPPAERFIANSETPRSVTVAAGESVTDQDLGLYQLVHIAGFIFHDTNNNGGQDGNEAVLDGIVVKLLDMNGNVVATTTSAPWRSFPHGVYEFNVKPGAYQVQAIDLAATTQPAPRGTPFLTSGRDFSGFSVGLSDAFHPGAGTTATISGFTFNDANSDGMFDGQEIGINGQTVQLLDAAGDPIAITTTTHIGGFDGAYSFSGLRAASYGIRFTPPHGTSATTPVLLNLGAVVAGQSVSVNGGSISNAGTISVSGTVFADTNRDGNQSLGEKGLAAIDVLLIKDAGTSSAKAVQTFVTDASGGYAVHGLAPGNYSIVVATPAGNVATTPTTVPVGTLATGDVGTANIGFAVNSNPVQVPVPEATVLNIILRGQSNAQYFVQYGLLDKLKADLQIALGFDGVHQKVNILADFFKSDGVNTINSGTGIVNDWLRPIGGNYKNGWIATPLELGLLTDIARQSADFRAAPTAVVWLHNEADSDNTNLTSDMWESAARFEAGLVRGVLGQDAKSVPYLFVNAIPFPSDGQGSDGSNRNPPITATNQAIRIGMAALAADPAFNGLIAAQASDLNMNSEFDGNSHLPNGRHTGLLDAQTIGGRLLQSLAETFASSALPGSPVALAGGQLDNQGPQVIAASTVMGHPDQLLLLVQFDNATSISPLNSDFAAHGGGWSVRDNALGDSSNLKATGVSAKVIDASHLLITFDNPVPADGKLFYAWGSGRLAAFDQLGHGNAIYDDRGVPVWTNPNGVGITPPLVNQGSIAGTVFFDANGNNVFDPGGGDVSLGGLAVILKDANGATIATAIADSVGHYSFGGLAAGTYTIAFGDPGRGLLTSPQSVTLTAGQSVPNMDTGFYSGGTIYGFSFLDANHSGTPDDGEGVNGARVDLIDSQGRVVATTTTSPDNPNFATDGAYVFMNLAEGSYSVRFTASPGLALVAPNTIPITLSRGQTEEIDSSLKVVDTTKPLISLMIPVTHVEATSSAGAAISFSGVAHDAVDGTDAVVFKEGTTVVTSGQVFGLGSHTVVASATDAAGNAADPVSFSFTVSDTTKPFISLMMPVTQIEATSSAGAAISFSGVAYDAVDGIDAVVFKEGTTVVTSGQVFGRGSHTVVASATDAAGNAANPVGFSFKVSDTTKPIISVMMPAAHVEATSSGGAAISFSGVAHDAVDGTDAVVFKEGTTVVTSGQMFGPGAHTIAASATDVAGNAADTLNFSFTINPYVPTTVNNSPTVLAPPVANPFDHFDNVGELKAWVLAGHPDPSTYVFQHDVGNSQHAWLI